MLEFLSLLVTTYHGSDVFLRHKYSIIDKVKGPVLPLTYPNKPQGLLGISHAQPF